MHGHDVPNPPPSPFPHTPAGAAVSHGPLPPLPPTPRFPRRTAAGRAALQGPSGGGAAEPRSPGIGRPAAPPLPPSRTSSSLQPASPPASLRLPSFVGDFLVFLKLKIPHLASPATARLSPAPAAPPGRRDSQVPNSGARVHSSNRAGAEQERDEREAGATRAAELPFPPLCSRAAQPHGEHGCLSQFLSPWKTHWKNNKTPPLK